MDSSTNHKEVYHVHPHCYYLQKNILDDSSRDHRHWQCYFSAPVQDQSTMTIALLPRLARDTWPDIVSGCSVGKRVALVLVQVDKLGYEFFCSDVYSEHTH